MEQSKENKECSRCKHLIHSDDNPGFNGNYYLCDKTGYDNLRGFPFKTTKCRKFEKKDTDILNNSLSL